MNIPTDLNTPVDTTIEPTTAPTTAIAWCTVPEALADIRAGRMIVVTDHADRENEGDLIMAAELATPEAVNFMTREGRGMVCVPMPPARLAALDLPQMVTVNTAPYATAFTVTVDAVEGLTTGISAFERATTIRKLADGAARPGDFARPGHIFPLAAAPGGVLERPGHTEAALDLARLAGLAPAGVLCEILAPDGTMARGDALAAFARAHGLKVLAIDTLIAYRRRTETIVERLATAALPTDDGRFTVTAFRDTDGASHLALTLGDRGGDLGVDVDDTDESRADGHARVDNRAAPDGRAGVDSRTDVDRAVVDRRPTLVRVHSECLTGDVFGSRRCDCGAQLDAAVAAIAREGAGVIVYLRQEGRGIGLANKIRAYALQDGGLDTVDANHQLGFPADRRDFRVAGAILTALGIARVRLLTNNPAKVEGLEDWGIDVVERVPLLTTPHADNVRYLATKRDRLGHALGDIRIGSGGR